jgi:hypothetical protein
MAFFDVFNGDADGICSLTQLHHAAPRSSTLVTGVKRDIDLLKQVRAGAGDSVVVLDVSLDKNREPLQKLLEAGAEVFYCDHHFAGEIPGAPNLDAVINEAADVCTSLLVNGRLKGQFALWAVVGAFGDNLNQSALAVARTLQLGEAQIRQLENLGTYLNYNGYGEKLEDLHFHPADLFRAVQPYQSPFDFIADAKDAFGKLENGYRNDMASAQALKPLTADADAAAFVLPDEPWARRVSGVYSNDLANLNPARAHAVLTQKAEGGFLVSVRAPLKRKTGADELCRQFPTGGGRQAAAGINHLPQDQLDAFLAAFRRQFALSA